MGEEIQRIQQVRRCPTLIELLGQQILEQSVEVQRVIHSHRLSEVYNTQVQYIVMNSQKAPQTVEVSQQQYKGMNVDVLVIWRHTDSAGTRTGPSLMYEWKETLSSHNDMCQRFEGYRSQYSDKASVASGVSRTP